MPERLPAELFAAFGQVPAVASSPRRDRSVVLAGGSFSHATLDFPNYRGNIAAFDIRKRNVATADPTDTSFAVHTGEQRVRGLELDVTGHLTPRWQLIASGSHLDAIVSEDELFAVGNRLTNVPRWSGRLWSSYAPGGAAQGLTLAGGVPLVGQRAGDLDNGFGVDRCTVHDATIRYAVPGTRPELSLTARNLTDADYIESTVTRLENYPGAPRSILSAVRARF